MHNPESQLTVLPQCALAREVEPSAWNALKEIYDDASDEKVALVIDYCKARRLDPLKKPVHIVSVWSNRRKAMVETIWPSISEIRITAMRTGLFAGQDETKFGPTQTQKLGNVEVTFPEWAQITVYRMVGAQRCAFPGPRCYFLESYATRRKDDYAPNAMWEKRTWGQLEKCAEAAALRRAFPEELGGQATAEEAGGRATDEPINVTSTASETTTTPATDAPPPEVKRAAVPRKNKGAAAATPATDVTVAAATPPAAIPGEPPPVPKPTPDVKTVTPEPTPESTPAPAPEPTQPPAPAPQPARSRFHGRIQHPDGPRWPRVPGLPVRTEGHAARRRHRRAGNLRREPPHPCRHG